MSWWVLPPDGCGSCLLLDARGLLLDRLPLGSFRRPLPLDGPGRSGVLRSPTSVRRLGPGLDGFCPGGVAGLVRGDVFHSDGYLMLRGENPEWDDRGNSPGRIEQMAVVDDGKWQAYTMEPRMYLFGKTRAHVVFDRAGVAVPAEQVQVILEALGPGVKWEALYPVEGTRKPNPAFVRVRGTDGQPGAYLTPLEVEVSGPGKPAVRPEKRNRRRR